MENKGYFTNPRILFESITFLARVLPVRSGPTLIELLIGAMLTQAGFVTEAWLAIHPLRSRSAYYKWFQQGKWSWGALGVQLARLVVTLFPQPIWFLIFDVTFIYRALRKAPGSGIYHQHGNKANRPQHVLELGFHAIGQVRKDTAYTASPLPRANEAGHESMVTNLHRKL